MFSGISSFDRRSLSATSFLCCPHCGCANIKKHGKEHGHQRWYCKDCHKTFAGRSDTILFASKLKPGQLRRMLSLLSDGVLTHQIAHQVKVSIQTVILWKRKLQHLVKTQENIVLSGKIVVDETYIHVPAKERSKIRKRGLSKDLVQIAVAVDEKGRSLALLNGKGRASKQDSEQIFRNHIAPNSIVIHDKGWYGKAFGQCDEVAIDSQSREAHALLNPINRFCNTIQRLFKVHLRIHPHNTQKYLDEFVERREIYDDEKYEDYFSKISQRIFESGKCLKRRELRLRQQHYC